MKAKFQMGLWQRIKAASDMWWAIVVTGELPCGEDEELEILRAEQEAHIEIEKSRDALWAENEELKKEQKKKK